MSVSEVTKAGPAVRIAWAPDSSVVEEAASEAPAPEGAGTPSSVPPSPMSSPEMGRPSSSPAGSPMGRKKSLAAQDPIWAAAVMQSVLLKKLGGAELKYIKSALKTVTFSAGDTVYRQDEHPDEAYVVKAGQFVARERTPGGDERMLRIYREAASFGSFELLYTGQQRSCTVTCVEPGTLWVISRRVFDAKLKAPPAAANPLEQKALLGKVRDVPLFSEAGLTAAHLTQLARAAIDMKVAPGERLCSKGDEADTLFVVVDGSCVARSEPGDPQAFEFVMNAPTVFGGPPPTPRLIMRAFHPAPDPMSRSACHSASLP